MEVSESCYYWRTVGGEFGALLVLEGDLLEVERWC